MLNRLLKFLATFVLVATFPAVVDAATHPTDNTLLRLVPGRAELISGIADPGTRGAVGRLLLVTENNNRDFDDALSLLGVDANKIIKEVIQVASSSTAGDLTDHLLLLAGRFNSEIILKAALGTDAVRVEYRGVGILALQPFPRERQRFSQLRWLAIMDNKVLIFGVPSLVTETLDRYEDNKAADPSLLQHLAELRPDVNSWSVGVSSPAVWNAYRAPDPPPAECRTTLKEVGFSLGIHYGRADRVDFALHIRDSGRCSAFTQVQSFLAGLRSVGNPRTHLEEVEQDAIRGSVIVQVKQLDDWLEARNASLVLLSRQRESN
jgi:hypothetical protein